MSRSEKTAAFYLTFIKKIGEFYLKDMAISNRADLLAKFHNVSENYTESDKKFLLKQFEDTEKYLERRNLNVSQIFLYFLVQFVCMKFISLPISHTKKQAWKALQNYVHSQLPKNHFLFNDEKEKASEVFEFIEIEIMARAA